MVPATLAADLERFREECVDGYQMEVVFVLAALLMGKRKLDARVCLSLSVCLCVSSSVWLFHSFTPSYASLSLSASHSLVAAAAVLGRCSRAAAAGRAAGLVQPGRC
jgi:hypothetical protein